MDDLPSYVTLAERNRELERAVAEARMGLTASLYLLHVPAVAAALAVLSNDDLAHEQVPAKYIALRGQLAAPLRNFAWVLPEELCGCGRPLSRMDLIALREKGVRHVVTLTEEPLPASWMKAVAMRAIHVPVPDRQAPRVEQMEEAVAAIDAGLQSGGAVAVHCLAGLGRTNSVLGAYLVHRGRTAAEANDVLRRLRPENPDRGVSERAVLAFATHRGEK